MIAITLNNYKEVSKIESQVNSLVYHPNELPASGFDKVCAITLTEILYAVYVIYDGKVMAYHFFKSACLIPILNKV